MDWVWRWRSEWSGAEGDYLAHGYPAGGPAPDDLRSTNQHRINDLRDQLLDHREDYGDETTDRLSHDRDDDYRLDDDQQIEARHDLNSGLGYWLLLATSGN